MRGTDCFANLDASVVIDGTDPAATLYPKIGPALRGLPLTELGTSELVRLECLVQPRRAGDPSRIALLERFFGEVVDLVIDCAAYDLAINLRATHKALKTPDAIHLATALRYGCGEFWTNDLDLAKRLGGPRVPDVLRGRFTGHTLRRGSPARCSRKGAKAGAEKGRGPTPQASVTKGIASTALRARTPPARSRRDLP